MKIGVSYKVILKFENVTILETLLSVSLKQITYKGVLDNYFKKCVCTFYYIRNTFIILIHYSMLQYVPIRQQN